MQLLKYPSVFFTSFRLLFFCYQEKPTAYSLFNNVKQLVSESRGLSTLFTEGRSWAAKYKWSKIALNYPEVCFPCYHQDLIISHIMELMRRRQIHAHTENLLKGPPSNTCHLSYKAVRLTSRRILKMVQNYLQRQTNWVQLYSPWSHRSPSKHPLSCNHPS